MIEVRHQNNMPEAYLSVGLDIGSDFTWMSILTPGSVPIGKPFKIEHSSPTSREAAIQRIKEAQEEYSLEAYCFAESTGIYHIPLLCYFRDKGFECSLINPIITNSSTNLNVRKVHNDRFDSQKIAQLGLNRTLKTSLEPSDEIRDLRNLVRDYYDYTDQRTANVLQLTAILDTSFPMYTECFDSVTSLTSLAILKKWPTPDAFLTARRASVLKVLRSSKRGEAWAAAKYDALRAAASDALVFGGQCASDAIRIRCCLQTISTLDELKDSLVKQMRTIVESDSESTIAANIAHLQTIPGAGFLTAVTLVAEMGDVEAFSSARQLTAFWGVDPGVRQSGHSQTQSCHMSKRGSPDARRALHTLTRQSIRTIGSKPMNPVLHAYYEEKCKSKPKLVAQGAVMHKLCFIIFAILRDQCDFRLLTPEEHIQEHQQRSAADTSQFA